MFRSLAGTLAAYALIWAIFLIAPVSRSAVLEQLGRLRDDSSSRLPAGAIAGLALVALNVIWVVLLGSRVFGGWSRPSLLPLLLTLLYTCVVATTEELIVRGVMLTRLRRWVSDPTAILITTIVFSAMHVGRRDFSAASVTQYAIDGVLLGWAAVRTGSIWFGVGWHWAKNFGVALAFGLSRNLMPPVVRLGPTGGAADHGADLVTYAIAVPLAVVVVLALTRGRR